MTEEKSSTNENDNDDAKKSAGGDGEDDNVVVYTMKVSPSDLERNHKEDETQQLSPWAAKAVELFSSLSSEEASDEKMLSSDLTDKVSEIFKLVLN